MESATGDVRAAASRRSLFALGPRAGAAASAAVTGAVLTSTAFGAAPGVSAATAAVVAAGFGARVGGRTVGEWVSLRRGAGRLPQQAVLFDRDGVGVVFDGRTVSACVEITPRPWQLTTITAAGHSEGPIVTAEQLRLQLTQYDIRCARMTVVCAGYKFAAADALAGVLDTLIGPVSAPLGATTVIVVSLDPEVDALPPAYRRAPKNQTTGQRQLPDGLCRAVTVAAARVKHALAETGMGGRLMSPQRVRAFHDTVLTQVAAPLSRPSWASCGQAGGAHTRTFVPARGYWNADAAAAWNQVKAHRQYTTLTLTPAGGGRALAQPLITYLAGGDMEGQAVGCGLRPAVGQQVAGLAQALPVAAGLPLRTPGAVIDDRRRLGFGIPAGGAGMFVGTRADKTRVFVAVSPAVDPLWLCGPELFAVQMVGRLSAQDLRIAVMIDEPIWKRLVTHRAAPALTAGTLGSAPVDVVVCTPQFWERNRELCAGKAVLLVTAADPGRLATNSLSVVTGDDGRAQIRVDVDAQHTTVGWELTPLERRTLLGDADSGGIAPSEGDTPRLSELVQVPVTAPRRKQRRVEPAPVVETVAVADPAVVAAEAAAPRPVRKRRVRVPNPPVHDGPQVRPVPQAQLPPPAAVPAGPVRTRPGGHARVPSPPVAASAESVREDRAAWRPPVQCVPQAQVPPSPPAAAAGQEVPPAGSPSPAQPPPRDRSRAPGRGREVGR